MDENKQLKKLSPHLRKLALTKDDKEVTVLIQAHPMAMKENMEKDLSIIQGKLTSWNRKNNTAKVKLKASKLYILNEMVDVAYVNSLPK